MFNKIKKTERNIRLLNRMFGESNQNPIRFSRHNNIKYGISMISVKYNKKEIGYFELDTDLYQILKHVAICKATDFVYNNIDLLENESIDDVNSKLSNYISLDCINRFLNFDNKNSNPTSVNITKDKITIKTKEFDDNYFVRDMDNDFENQKKLRLRLNKKGVITNKHAITKYIEYCIFESFKYISNELMNEKKYQI